MRTDRRRLLRIGIPPMTRRASHANHAAFNRRLTPGGATTMRFPITMADWRLALLAMLALCITPLLANAQTQASTTAKAPPQARPEATAITRIETWADPNIATLMLVDD